MNMRNECIPCVTKQLITLAEKLTTDGIKQKRIIEHGLKIISIYAYEKSAPELTGLIYEYAKEVTGIVDPYKDEKDIFNQVALNLVNEYNLKEKIKSSDEPLDTAIRLSIAGNIIDFSLGEMVEEHHVREAINMSLSANLYGDQINLLINEINIQDDILILGDNSGEIVFDKLLIELIKDKDITYVVKGGPIVNDAIIEDAKAIGLDRVAKIISTGAAYQGVIFDQSSDEFKLALSKASLVISKGQANYECLNEYKHNNMFFLLRGKCQVIADVIGCTKGDFICIKN